MPAHTRLLDMIHKFLVKAVATGNIIARLRRLATRNRRKVKIMSMHEELLSLLRRIEVSIDKTFMHSSHVQIALRETTTRMYYLL